MQMMGFGTAIVNCFKHSFTFEGRASRSEFWWFFLFYNIVSTVGGFVGGFIGVMVSGDDFQSTLMIADLVSWIFILPLLPAYLSVAARRLHDGDKSGWFMLIPDLQPDPVHQRR